MPGGNWPDDVKNKLGECDAVFICRFPGGKISGQRNLTGRRAWWRCQRYCFSQCCYRDRPGLICDSRWLKSAASLGRLDLPLFQAQSVISGAMGSSSAAIAAVPRTGGYGLGGGGVAAHLSSREVAMKVSGGALSLALVASGPRNAAG
jgi:hypothetical protein